MKNAGRYNRRITLQSKGVTRAANGEEVVVWNDVAYVWAAVEPLRGREFFAAAQMTDAVDYRITIRKRSGVVREMRVALGSALFDVVSVVESVDRRELELMVVSGVRNGA